jgi:hypothetical protein
MFEKAFFGLASVAFIRRNILRKKLCPVLKKWSSGVALSSSAA